MAISARKLLEKEVGPVSVAMLLRVYRTRNDLSQTSLAKKLGVTKGFISNIENGVKKLSLSKLISIAEDLGANPKYFAKVWLEDEAREGADSRSERTSMVSRETGEFVAKSIMLGGYGKLSLYYSGQCEVAPFAGFPEFETKF